MVADLLSSCHGQNRTLYFHSVDRRIVTDHCPAVFGQPHVKLKSMAPVLQREIKRFDCVFFYLRRAAHAPMTEEQRLVSHTNADRCREWACRYPEFLWLSLPLHGIFSPAGQRG